MIAVCWSKYWQYIQYVYVAISFLQWTFLKSGKYDQEKIPKNLIDSRTPRIKIQTPTHALPYSMALSLFSTHSVCRVCVLFIHLTDTFCNFEHVSNSYLHSALQSHASFKTHERTQQCLQNDTRGFIYFY